MAKGPLSKSALIQTLVDKHAPNLTRKDVRSRPTRCGIW